MAGYVYFTDGQGAWRVDTETCEEEQLASFATEAMREKGMVAAAMGTTALSYDDQWWAVPVKMGAVTRLVVIDTCSGASEVIVERDSIGHPEFHPKRQFAVALRRAVLRADVGGKSGRKRPSAGVRARGGTSGIVHETWHPRKRELLTTRWPHGVIGVDVDTGAVRSVCSFNAWHPMVSRDGARMVADTTFPDSGLQVFESQRRGRRAATALPVAVEQ